MSQTTDDRLTQEAVVEAIQNGSEEDKVFQGETFGEIDLSEHSIDAETTHPLVFERCNFEEGINLTQVDLNLPLNFEGCAISEVVLDEAQFAFDVLFTGCKIREGLSAFETLFQRDFDFKNSLSEGEFDMEQAEFGDDARFYDSRFKEKTSFQGAEFSGRSNDLDDNVDFSGAVFCEEVVFNASVLRACDFREAEFRDRADFERSQFEYDALFSRAKFHGPADFDEARFARNGDFEQAEFRGDADFRGANFRGGTDFLSENAVFENATFYYEAEFNESQFSTANFVGTTFSGPTDFSNAEFTDVTTFKAHRSNDRTYVDFTEAAIKEGEIIQPKEGRVRYDFTRASVGEVHFKGHESNDDELLDFVRFRETIFNEFDGYEFDFDRHSAYLDRNDWVIHEFNASEMDEEEIEESMPPEKIESTYLKAKNAASDAGFTTAAGEFRVKRQQYARKKYFHIARGGNVTLTTRLSNLVRGLENGFMGVTCGHGMRFWRICAVFILYPILPGLLFAFGGSRFSTSVGADQAVMDTFLNIMFSYVSFTTIGYGGIGPQAPLAWVLAISSGFMSVILGGLVLYSLVKRSEV